MADKWPLANGNWSTAANWNGGTLPVDGDDIYLDNRTITLDQTISLPNARLLTTQRSGGTAGGVLSVSVPTTANISLLAIVAGTSTPLNIQSNFTGAISGATITGSQTTTNMHAMTLGNGNHAVTFANCTFVGGPGANRNGLSITSGSGTVVFSGCTATAGLGGIGVSIAGGTASITGTLNLNALAGATSQALNISVNPTPIVLSGTCVHSGNNGLLFISNGSTIRYTCSNLSFVSSQNVAVAVFQFVTATTGNELTFANPVTMHGQSAGPYLVGCTTAGGKVCVFGDITCGTGGVASWVFSITAGTVERVGEDICGNSANGNLIANITAISTAFYIADKIRCAAGGPLILPYGPGLRFKSTSRIIAQDSLGNPVTLQTPSGLTDLPIPSNVRDGVTYNNGTQVGTYNAGNAIAADVWSYATRTITAGGLDAAGVRAAIGMAAADLDTQLDSLLGNVSTVVNVLPLNAAVQSRVRGTTIEVFSGETVQVSIAVVDAAGNAVSLTGRTLRIVLESSSSTVDKTVIEDGSIARSGNTITFAISGGVNGARRLWSLRDTSGDVVLAHGVVSTSYAPKKD